MTIKENYYCLLNQLPLRATKVARIEGKVGIEYVYKKTTVLN